jgi:betaine-aldehyde dehydrogenase
MKPEPLWIGGREAAARGGESFPIRNPATGETVALAALGGGADVERAVAASREGLASWSRLGPRDRAARLFAFASVVRKNIRGLAEAETRNTGKPLRDSLDEAGVVADCLEYYAGAVQKFFGETIPVTDRGLDFTLREPIGICGLIVPWNFPMMIASWKFAPALAAGNAVILKPASLTPLSALMLGRLSKTAGLPDGVFNVITGPGETAGRALVEHPEIGKISFTGETATGAGIAALAAPSIKRVSLELGGKSPNIVFADADFDLCVERSVFSVFGNAGQDCCARSRAFVERRLYKRFVEAVVERARRLRLGDPRSPKTEIGPLISRAQRRRVEDHIRSGVGHGARLLCGGTAPEGKGLSRGSYLRPAVLDRVRPEMRIFREEIFGPVLCVMPFKDEDEAVALSNASDYGLSASVWTRDIGRALRVARAVKSGVVSINSSHSVHLEAPFGGYKKSGVGRELGFKALDGYTEVKNVFVAER